MICLKPYILHLYLIIASEHLTIVLNLSLACYHHITINLFHTIYMFQQLNEHLVRKQLFSHAAYTLQRISVGCFGLNGPLRQYFSLYRAVSQREGERGEKG